MTPSMPERIPLNRDLKLPAAVKHYVQELRLQKL